jgi:hypothetical protein
MRQTLLAIDLDRTVLAGEPDLCHPARMHLSLVYENFATLPEPKVLVLLDGTPPHLPTEPNQVKSY